MFVSPVKIFENVSEHAAQPIRLHHLHYIIVSTVLPIFYKRRVLYEHFCDGTNVYALKKNSKPNLKKI